MLQTPLYTGLLQLCIAGSSQSLLQKFQSVQNMAAHMVTGEHRCDRITPILKDLH